MTECHQLKMKAAGRQAPPDGCRHNGALLRIIQSVPSKKPSHSNVAGHGWPRAYRGDHRPGTDDRACAQYIRTKGLFPEWINQRLQTIRARKELTDAWGAHGVEAGKEYAILTDEVTKRLVRHDDAPVKNYKGLKKENLRDNMSTLELALNMLAEATTTELTNAQNPQGLEENRVVAQQGGRVAGNARKEISPDRTAGSQSRQCADDVARKHGGWDD